MTNVTSTYWTMNSTWSEPELVQTIVKDESIELIYTQHERVTTNLRNFQSRCYKIIFSCIDGKWNKSEPIYGEIFPATEESYEFND